MHVVGQVEKQITVRISKLQESVDRPPEPEPEPRPGSPKEEVQEGEGNRTEMFMCVRNAPPFLRAVVDRVVLRLCVAGC
jgi:hypothetical protein